MIEDAGELVSLGADIVRLGAELKMARVDLNDASKRVHQLEAELQPKLIHHAQLIQAAAGLAFPMTTAPAQLVEQPSGPPREALPEWAPAIARAEAQEPFVGDMTPSVPATNIVAPGPSLGLRKPAGVNPNTQLKNRVKDYLKRANPEEGISAMDIADHLKIDAQLVREAMREMRTGR